MPTSLPPLRPALPLLSTLIALLALTTGIHGLTSPHPFATTLGVPLASPASLASFIAARNLGSGITMLALLYTGQRKAVGTMLMCGVVTAGLDAWICWRCEGAAEGKAAGHLGMGVVAGGLGAGMYWG